MHLTYHRKVAPRCSLRGDRGLGCALGFILIHNNWSLCTILRLFLIHDDKIVILGSGLSLLFFRTRLFAVRGARGLGGGCIGELRRKLSLVG